MRAGRLRNRVVIEYRTDQYPATYELGQVDWGTAGLWDGSAVNTFGEVEPGWDTLATVWASVEPMEGREFLGSGLELDATPTRFRFRYGSELSDLNPAKHRLTLGSRTFDLVSVNNVEQRNREFECVGVYRG